MQPSRVFPTHRLGNWVDGNRMHLKIHQNSFYGISFLILCTGGSDVITCRGGITSGSYISQSCIYLLLRHLFVRLNCVLGGRALALQGLWRFCPYLLRQYIFSQKFVYWIFRVQ